MTKRTGRYVVNMTAIGPSYSVFHKGDVVSEEMLSHAGREGKPVRWDIDRLLAIGAIEHTDADISVAGGEFYAPGPVFNPNAVPNEGDSANAPHFSPTQEENIAAAAHARATGTVAEEPARVSAQELRAAAEEARRAADTAAGVPPGGREPQTNDLGPTAGDAEVPNVEHPQRAARK